MAEPMRLRATQNGELVEVKILIKHRMISRLTWDISGHLNLPHYIQTIRGTCNQLPEIPISLSNSKVASKVIVSPSPG
jgi:hypothetical protein